VRSAAADILLLVGFLDLLIEKQILAAMERGEFDDLPGKGKPLPDLDVQRSPGWFAEQLVRRERSRVLGEDTRLEVASRRVSFWHAPTLAVLRDRVVAANRHIAETNRVLEPEDRLALFDFSAIVETWRTARRRG
jgi:hypothetical protein